MRIISGVYKGKTIHAPKNLPVRPTTDFAKEALFNVLNNHFDFGSVTVLDLFCGTGNISYEFLSREVKQVIAVDRNFHCINFVRKTANVLKAPQIKPLKYDVFKFLESCSIKFDIIFADPPYDLDNISKISELVFENDLLNPEGWLIVEHSKYTDLSQLERFDGNRKYGNVTFSFFK